MSLLVMVTIAIFILQITQYTFERNKKAYLKEQLNANIALYNSNLSEKLYFLANSATFIDYLNSGEVTKKSLNYEIDRLIKGLKIDEVTGIKIINKKSAIALERGTTSTDYIKLELCYFNQMLNKEYGSCSHQMTVYLDKDKVINRYQSINPQITFCTNCHPTLLLPSKHLGSLDIIAHSNTQANLHIPEQDNNLFIWLNYLLMIILFSFALWNRHWVNRIVHQFLHLPLAYIVRNIPIKKRLQSNKNYIKEYNDLIININNWKKDSELIQSQKEAIALGKLAAQVAHDIRSPLTALEIVYHQNAQFNDEIKHIYKSATSRIHDIANQLLHDYKSTVQDDSNFIRIYGPLPFYLDNITILKNIEYQNKALISIKLQKEVDFSFIHCDISIFKRIISNLINNAYESYDAKQNKEIIVELALLHDHFMHQCFR